MTPAPAASDEEDEMTEILIVGGGFAGVWAAAGAKRLAHLSGRASEVSVTLVAASDDLVIRPRLYEDDPQSYRVALDRVLGPIGVYRVAATVTAIDTAGKQVTAVERDGSPRTLGYDRLVLAGPLIPKAEAGEAAILSDLDAHAHDAYALDGVPSLILVRPDGHIAFRGPASRPELLKAYCEKVFGAPVAMAA